MTPDHPGEFVVDTDFHEASETLPAHALLQELTFSFWQMKQQLAKLIGPQLASAVIQHTGQQGGTAFVRALGLEQDAEPVSALWTALAAYTAAGLGEFKITDLGFLKADQPQATLRIDALSTFERRDASIAVAQHVGCDYTCGVLVGFVQTITGSMEVLGVESGCQVGDANSCRFELVKASATDAALLAPTAAAAQPFDVLRRLFDRLPLGLAVFDSDAKLQRCNATWCELFRHRYPSAADLTPDVNLFEFVPAAETSLRPLMERALGGETVREDNVPIKNEEQTGYWDMVWVPITLGGQVTGTVLAVTDVTERVKMRQELERTIAMLQEREERLGLVLKATNDGVWDWDIDAGTVYYSARWQTMLGYEEDELPHRFETWQSLIHPGDVERSLETTRAYLAGESDTFELEHRLRHKDGSYRWILARGTALHDSSGELHEGPWGPTTVMRMVGAHTDTTRRKETEGALKYLIDFQNVLTGISTEFINLSPEEIKGGIEEALATIGAFMGVDRSYIFQFSGDKTTMSCTYEWCAEDIEPQRDRLQNFPVDYLMWSNQQLLDGKVLHIPDVASLPPEAEAERREFQSQGIKSLITVPMTYLGETLGFLGFDAVRARKTWSEDSRTLLRIVGEIIVNALEHKRAQAIRAGQQQFLELLARGGDFTGTLENLVRLIEEQWPGMIALVLLVEDGRLHHAASVNLSDEYLASIEGLEIGPQVGSCGTAAHLRERVIVEDIAVDPRWANLRDIALRDGLHACWSEPILSGEGEVVGTFAMYYRYPRSPSTGELHTIEIAAHLAGVAIEQKHAREALQESERMLTTLMSNLPGMAYRCRNDAEWTMRFVSEGGRDLTGYAPSELIENHQVSYRELIVAEDREMVRASVEAAIAQRSSFQMTYRIQTRDGKRKWVWEQGQAVFNKGDEATALEGFATDITERVQAQQLLEAQIAQRTRDVERRRQVAESLRDIMAVLGANRPLQELLDRIVSQARWLLDADGCVIYRYDQEQQDTIAEAMMGMPAEFETDLRHFPLKEGSAPQQATLRQQPYPVPDIQAYFAEIRQQHETLSEESEHWMEVIGRHFQAKVALPVVVRDEIFGGIELFYQELREFTDEDIDLALTFSDQAGLAIENAQLYMEVQRRADESRALFNVQRAITSNLTLDTVLQMIAEEARSIIGAYRAVVLLVDEEGERLVVQQVAGEEPSDLVGEWIPVRESVSGRSMLEGEPVLVTDMNVDPRVDAEKMADSPFRSQISVPLLAASGPLGIIAVSDPDPRQFDEDDVRLLTMLASAAVTGLENARLYEEEQERREEAERHRRIAEGLRDVLAVLNSDYSFAEILDHIVYQASQLLGASAGVIYRADREADTVVIEAASGAPESLVALQEFPNIQESVNRSILRREPHAVSNLSSEVDTDIPEGVEGLPPSLIEWKRIVRAHYRAYIAVPLIIKDELYGALALYYPESREFDEEDIDLALALGGQVALGIESARLYAETRRRADETQTLLAVQRAVTSRLDPDAVLQLIADEARRLTMAEQGAVYVLREDELEIAVVSGDVPPDVVGYRLPVAESIAGLVVREQQSCLVTNAQEDERVHRNIVELVGASSFIVVPLMTGTGPLGTITVANKRSGVAFGEEDERVLTMMASSAAIALENARLYQEEQARRAEAERRRRVAEGLRGILTILNSNRSLEEILDYIVEQAGEILGAEGGVIYRINTEAKEIYIEATCQMPEAFDTIDRLPLIDSAVNRAVLEGRSYGVHNFQQRLAEMDVEAKIRTLIPDGIIEHQPPRYTQNMESWITIVAENFQSYMSVPLRVKGDIYGGVSFFYSTPQTFSDEDFRLAAALSDQAALAIENARLRERAEESAVAQERTRLARDLHDAVSQTLFSASIIAEVLPRIWERDAEEGLRRLEELRQLTRGALAEMRMLLVELRPSALLDTPLRDLLGHLVEAFTGKTRVPVTLHAESGCELPSDVQIAFYRVAQESMNNAAKHANAHQLWVDLRCADERVVLTVRDDGRGFDPSSIPTGHFGVEIMHERAASIGADLDVASMPEEGTVVCMLWDADMSQSEVDE